MNLRNISAHTKRRCFFVALVFLSALLSQTGFIPALFSASPMIMVPLAVIIALYEKSMPGMAFGILCGALWDLTVIEADGFYTVLLAVTGFVCGSLSAFFVRTNLLSSLLLTFFACGACSLFHWGIHFLRKGYDGIISILFTHYLPSILYTLVFGILFYYIIDYIVKHTKEKKKLL